MTLTSSLRCVLLPVSLIAPRSTLLSWRSRDQIARAWSPRGASRSLRMSSLASLSQAIAFFSAGTASAAVSASWARRHQAATSCATGIHRSSRARRSASACSANAVTAAVRAGHVRWMCSARCLNPSAASLLGCCWKVAQADRAGPGSAAPTRGASSMPGTGRNNLSALAVASAASARAW